jgi:hypothetical protein
MKVLTVDNHPKLTEEIASVNTDHPYWIPDPSGLGQSGDPEDVSLYSWRHRQRTR